MSGATGAPWRRARDESPGRCLLGIAPEDSDYHYLPEGRDACPCGAVRRGE